MGGNMSEEQHGIKETKELLQGVMSLAILMTKRFKDGFQMDDLSAILAEMSLNPEFRDAVSGLKKLPAEVKDIDLAEGMELGMLVLKRVPEVIKAAQ